MLYILFLIAVMPLFCLVGHPSQIFTPVTVGTRIVVSIKPFRKEVRRRSRGRSGVMLALGFTHFLIVPVSMPPILASAGGPPFALWFRLGVLLISAVFFEFLLNRQRLVRGSGLNRLARR
jgi:hypothetical protein